MAHAPELNVETDRLYVNGEPKKKKKKKRSHDELVASEIPAERDSSERKKKKKAKLNHAEVENAVETQHAADALLDVQPEDAPEDLSEERRKKKKKKKEKRNRDKHKESVVEEEELRDQAHQSDTDVDDDTTQDSTAALLNAIVAAVATTTPPESDEASERPAQAPQFQHHPSEHMVPPPPSFLPFHPPPPGFFPAYPGAPNGGQPPPFMAGLPPGVFSQLSYGSNEDVLRVLQDMDMSKFAGVMRTLGGGAPPAPPTVPHTPTFPPPPSFVPQPLVPHHTSSTPLGQVPVDSGTILGRPSKVANAADRRVRPAVGDPVVTHQTHAEHAEVLCTKWLGASKLAELVESEGLVYKKGKFSATEEQQLKSAIELYRTANKLDDAQLNDIIFPKNVKEKNSHFWTELTRAVPQRPIIAVYHHVRRAYHPLKGQGLWSPDEDARLQQAVMDLGQQWEKISARVGRMSSDCRDRYRNHILNREIRVSGAWSKEEEEELIRIVTDMTIKQGRDIDNDVFWGRVSELMGGRRGRQQCRIKWTDSLSKIVKNSEGQKPRWSQQDAYVLVHKVDSLNVRDDTEIDWKTLPDPDWNLWSAHTLQRRWLTMKKGIKGYEEMSHSDIMDILRVKKAHTPDVSAQNARKRKSRKIVSATTVNDEAATSSQPQPQPQPQVPVVASGSSTGPGTLAHALRIAIMSNARDSEE